MEEISKCTEKPQVITSKLPIKYKKSNFKFHHFFIEAGDLNAAVDVIKMRDSLFVWCGNAQQPVFRELALGMVDSTGNEHKVLSTKLMGCPMDTSSVNLAAKLSKRLDKQVFFSCNIPLDRLTLPLLERGLMEEIRNSPDYF